MTKADPNLFCSKCGGKLIPFDNVAGADKRAMTCDNERCTMYGKRIKK